MKVYAVLAILVVFLVAASSLVAYIDHNAVTRYEHARTMEALRNQKHAREQTEKFAAEANAAHEETRQRTALEIRALEDELAAVDQQIEAERIAAAVAREEAEEAKAAGQAPVVEEDPYCRPGCKIR